MVATLFLLQNKLATKVTIDTNTQIGTSNSTRPTNFEIGTTLLVGNVRSERDYNDVKRINAKVYPYYWEPFDDPYREMTVSIHRVIHDSYRDLYFPGTWLVKGFVTVQDVGYDKDLYLITRIA